MPDYNINKIILKNIIYLISIFFKMFIIMFKLCLNFFIFNLLFWIYDHKYWYKIKTTKVFYKYFPYPWM